VENISRPEERRFTSTLTQFAQRLDDDNWNGPLIIFVGIGKAQVSHAANATALKELSHVSY
jgi:siroheme synthase